MDRMCIVCIRAVLKNMFIGKANFYYYCYWYLVGHFRVIDETSLCYLVRGVCNILIISFFFILSFNDGILSAVNWIFKL